MILHSQIVLNAREKKSKNCFLCLHRMQKIHPARLCQQVVDILVVLADVVVVTKRSSGMGLDSDRFCIRLRKARAWLVSVGPGEIQ